MDLTDIYRIFHSQRTIDILFKSIENIPRRRRRHPTPVLLLGKIPWTEEPGGLQSMGSLRVGHDSVTSLSLFTFMHWRSKWQPAPVFLPGESQGWQSLVGCCLWGRTEQDTTEVIQQQQQQHYNKTYKLIFFFHLVNSHLLRVILILSTILRNLERRWYKNKYTQRHQFKPLMPCDSILSIYFFKKQTLHGSLRTKLLEVMEFQQSYFKS